MPNTTMQKKVKFDEMGSKEAMLGRLTYTNNPLGVEVSMPVRPDLPRIQKCMTDVSPSSESNIDINKTTHAQIGKTATESNCLTQKKTDYKLKQDEFMNKRLCDWRNILTNDHEEGLKEGDLHQGVGITKDVC